MAETKAVRARFEHANPILNVANLARSVLRSALKQAGLVDEKE